MNFSPEFFDLQLRFGAQAARVLDVPLAQALLERTHLFVRLGCGRRPDAGDPLWREFVEGLGPAGDPLAWTWSFHLAHRDRESGPHFERAVACFGFERLSADRVRLHFRADAVPPGAALAATNAPERRRELAALFATLVRDQPGTRVIGATWLYQREAYRRLFPPAYLAGAQPMNPPPWQRLPLWGQFLDRDGEVTPAAAQQLLERAAAARDEAGLAASFPLPVIAVDAPVSVFA